METVQIGLSYQYHH